MKNSIKTLTSLFVMVLIGLSFTATASKNVKVITAVKEIKNINKIVVKGNVELILTQGTLESVNVYDSYYSKNALVQQSGTELRISSFSTEKLVVAVNVKNLFSIEAGNNSTIRTVGKFNLLSLDVKLTDMASAQLDANIIKLTSSLKDQSSLKLAGTAEEHFAMVGSGSKINMEQFVAKLNAVHAFAPVYATYQPKKEDLASLNKLLQL